MDTQKEKCVLVIDDSAPLGIMANITSILSLSLGKMRPDVVGVDTLDKEGNNHYGLVQVPVPVLKASKEKIAEIRNTLFSEGFEDVSCVDFTNVAQTCMTYEDYTDTMLNSDKESIEYLGIAVVGDKKKVNKLTGSLGLLR